MKSPAGQEKREKGMVYLTNTNPYPTYTLRCPPTPPGGRPWDSCWRGRVAGTGSWGRPTGRRFQSCRPGVPSCSRSPSQSHSWAAGPHGNAKLVAVHTHKCKERGSNESKWRTVQDTSLSRQSFRLIGLTKAEIEWEMSLDRHKDQLHLPDSSYLANSVGAITH